MTIQDLKKKMAELGYSYETIITKKQGEFTIDDYYAIPEDVRVIVYDWEREEILNIYGFGDKIPVGIFDGKCEVDFSNIIE